jgi:hypothetical protein
MIMQTLTVTWMMIMQTLTVVILAILTFVCYSYVDFLRNPPAKTSVIHSDDGVSLVNTLQIIKYFDDFFLCGMGSRPAD